MANRAEQVEFVWLRMVSEMRMSALRRFGVGAGGGGWGVYCRNIGGLIGEGEHELLGMKYSAIGWSGVLGGGGRF